MTLHDTQAFLVETYSAAESLPDPTLWNGRTHVLVNSAQTPVTWSSVGVAPFQQGGTNVATVSIPRGQLLVVQSDGVRWIVKTGLDRSFFAGTAVSDGSGNATFAFPPGLFASAPEVASVIQAAASSNPIDYRITNLTATTCTIHVRQSPTLVVLSLSVLGVSAPLAGVTVHLIATPAGVTP